MKHNIKSALYEQFRDFFAKEFFDQFRYERPKMRAVLSGGYGIKKVLETSYNIYEKVRTSDIDVTLSTYKSSYTAERLMKHMEKKIAEFIATRPDPTEFKVKLIDFGHVYTYPMNFHRDYVFLISYKEEDFIDVALTNQRINSKMLDREASFKCGWPIKTADYYLKEMLTLIYMEMVPGVNDYCYYKRNPVSGELACKGLKDIKRAKLLCSVSKKNKYTKYCEILSSLTRKKLNEMTKEYRDLYFKDIYTVISP